MSNTTNIAIAVQILYDNARHLQDAAAMIGAAIASGTDITDEQLNTLRSANDLAKARLDADIANAEKQDEITLTP